MLHPTSMSPAVRVFTTALGIITACGEQAKDENVARRLEGGKDIMFPQELYASDGLHHLHFEHVPFVHGMNTYGYRGGIPGPTFRMEPGETLKIELHNRLFPEDGKPCGKRHEHYCETYITNLHPHGLHTSPKGKPDGLQYEGDNVFVMLQPGEKTQYEFEIPDNHMGGTHMYHPHHHHSTAIQAGGGAVGVMIVEDPPGYLPEEYANMVEKVLLISAHNLEDLQDMALAAGSNLLRHAMDHSNYYQKDLDLILVNGQVKPAMSIASHKWHRFRVVFAAVEHAIRVTSVSKSGGADCTLKLLAKDGVYLNTIPRDVPAIILYPGTRADVAVSCTCTSYPCTATLGSHPKAAPQHRRLYGPANYTDLEKHLEATDAHVLMEDIMELTVTETPGGTQVVLPTVSLPRPCYLVDLRKASIPGGNAGVLEFSTGNDTVLWNGEGLSMNWHNIHAKGGVKEWPSLATYQAGQVYEMTVQGINHHPLHIHVNPYQLSSMGGEVYDDGFFQEGDWHDTVMLHDLAKGIDVKLRFQTDQFAGKAVMHCHLLAHEDMGMMGWIDIEGEDGTVWPEAESLDPTCYRGAFGTSARRLADATASLIV